MELNKILAKLSLIILLLVLLMVQYASSDDDQDEEKCSNSLIWILTCYSYVGGNANAPTTDCCNGLKEVINTNKKCLCLVLYNRNDPVLGLSMNVTRSLGLTFVCKAPANIGECPALLHLNPNSTEAQVFLQNGHVSTKGTASRPTTTASPTTSPAAASSTPSVLNAPQKSDGSRRGKPWFGVEAVVTILFFWYFSSHLFI